MSYGSAADVLSEIARLIPSYAGMNYQAMDSGWGMITAASANGNKAALQAAVPAEQLSEEHPLVLAIDGAFDWGQDPMVSLAPTLSRDYVSRRKLFPGGVVEMSRTDADGIGVRQAWQVKFTSAHGDAVLPISIRTDLEPGVALVPYAFRDQAAAVLAGRRTTAVKAERA
jgi:predicted molibdopterin-dependent oxidoreductase YjgC